MWGHCRTSAVYGEQHKHRIQSSRSIVRTPTRPLGPRGQHARGLFKTMDALANGRNEFATAVCSEHGTRILSVRFRFSNFIVGGLRPNPDHNRNENGVSRRQTFSPFRPITAVRVIVLPVIHAARRLSRSDDDTFRTQCVYDTIPVVPIHPTKKLSSWTIHQRDMTYPVISAFKNRSIVNYV